MLLDDLLGAIGYTQSPFYRESSESPDLSVAHLLRDAKRADVRGTYFFRTAAGERVEARERPAVHVAEAKTIADAREIHRHLWNQGVNPFLVILLPHQIRVYTGFEFDPDDEGAGLIDEPLDTGHSLATIAKQLSFLNAESIDSGAIWQLKGHHLKTETRVDQELLRNLESLSDVLVDKHRVRPPDAHAVIGKFVYLYYLKHRDILSDPWMRDNGVEPDSVFSRDATLTGFRRLCDAVDDKFNGNIFPIHWSNEHAPGAEAVKEIARAFAGEEPRSGQMHLPFRAYDFSFIPIELLSAIYEQFLHDQGQGRKVGAFYTPEPAADYLISELDSVKKLKPGMKILDPCCGSGIFLVLAYRRLIELERQKRKDGKLSPRELKDILCGSIYGVERNRDACLVTEFSLILTLLSYVDPPELHRSPTSSFKFPNLHNDRIFESDFFDDESAFARSDLRFDWIVGNPPWMSVGSNDPDEQLAVKWIKSASTNGMPVARFRAAEAFSWKVRARVAEGGAIALFIQASSLTNAQSKEYRRAFFSENTVHRITNFSNFAYVLFPSAEEPAATLVFSPATPEEAKPPIIHYGPLLVNQLATQPGESRKQRTAWSVTICENEIQAVPSNEAAEGRDLTWKLALWGNHRDRRVFERIKRLFPDTLGALAERRNWSLCRGLELRKSKHDRDELSEHEPSLEGLKVLTGDRFLKSRLRFEIPDECLETNVFGTFIRERGGRAGLSLIKPPHLFLWTGFAAFSQKKFIFRERKIGLSAPNDADFLRAISALWASSVVQYFLFFLSSSWGLGRSVIDLEDAKAVPLPELSADQVKKLAALHHRLVEMESYEPGSPDIQTFLDQELVALLSVPPQIDLITKDFVETRLRLVKGNAPPDLTQASPLPQLEAYAKRLTSELDEFIAGQGRHHAVSVMKADKGIVATVEIVRSTRSLKPVVKEADAAEAKSVGELLKKAGKRLSQWAYVQRSVRIFAGNKVHICKLPRRLDWTETQALLDSDDIIAEVLAHRDQRA